MSREVVKDLIADELQTYLDDADVDPVSRSDAAPLVLTSWPDTGLQYPHVVVQEASITSSKFGNQRNDLWEHGISVLITVAARQDTEKFILKDTTRGFVLDSQNAELRDGGFHDGEIESTTESDFEDDPEITTMQMTVTGTVFSS